MRSRNTRKFACDFETTVYKGQTITQVWAACCVELYTDEVHIFHSIEEQFEFFKSLGSHLICYYHNLKFDGSFWLSYFMYDLHLAQASVGEGQETEWLRDSDMKNNTFKYSISDRGQWYTITIKTKEHIIEFRDSMKLLPFSIAEIGKSFNTEHQKSTMVYEGYRFPGCVITDKEQEYLRNDTLVLKEALEFMYNEGHSKLTIGSCCMKEFRKNIPKKEYDKIYPDVYQISLDKNIYGCETVGDYIKRSYKGGWCYLVPDRANQVIENGITIDVNSLYPSVMSSESGSKYPVGTPHFWSGNYIPQVCENPDVYYFIRIRTRFVIKSGMLPFIQIKGNFLYKPTEMLTTSDIRAPDGTYHAYYRDMDGHVHDTRVTMTMTMTDYILFREHYDVLDFEILDGCYFISAIGIFDDYIDKYRKIKMESTGARRTLAKLFLNNLYGKMASNQCSSFKVAYLKDDNSVGFFPVTQFDKKPGFIPIGSAITSYARNFTIRHAQMNYNEGGHGFIYADTDSIHCDLSPDKLNGIVTDPVKFCTWKIESYWDKGIFVRQKTYIEHIIKDDKGAIEKPFNNIKCAGMPNKCKHLLDISFSGDIPDENFTDEERDFISVKRDYTDFKVGLKVPGKLLPKRIMGGTLLVDTSYEMR